MRSFWLIPFVIVAVGVDGFVVDGITLLSSSVVNRSASLEITETCLIANDFS